MRKMLKFSALALVIGLVFGLAGCPVDDDGGKKGGEYDKYFDPAFRDNYKGTVEVIDPTEHDMLLFRRGALIDSSIVGGVRAGKEAKLNFSNESDFMVGGYEILYAIKLSEYKTAKGNSNIDYSVMVTYRNNDRFRVTIQSRYDGNYSYICFNRSDDWPMELRKNTPDGEKIAFLARKEAYYRVYSSTTDPFVAYPVWIAYNNLTRSIITFTPPSGLSDGSQTIGPETAPPDYYFPAGGTTTINFDIELPFATINITNNAPLSSQSAYFRNAGTRYTPEGNVQLINTGRRASFEIRSDGTPMNLNLALGTMQEIIVPVRVESSPSELPVIENGWFYTVSLRFKDGGDPDDANDYTAWLVKDREINQSQFLTAN
jgi:hypothetical protein